MNTLTLFEVKETAVYDMAAIDELARRNHWRFRVWLPRGVIAEPMTYNGFIITPVEKVPEEAKIQFNCLVRSGVHYKQILVAHEIPKPAPVAVAKPKPAPSISSGTASGVLSAVAPILLIGMVALPLILLQALVTVDPAVILVLNPDDTWLEILNWQE